MYYGKTQIPQTTAQTGWPSLTELDFLGRMPIPLRRPFKAGLDRVLAAPDHGLTVETATGGAWYQPFEALKAARSIDDLPSMTLTSWSCDAQTARLLQLYGEEPSVAAQPSHPACVAGGLVDPLGVFQSFAVIPLVFLVDHGKLNGRPVPRRWSDLLDHCYRGEVVFGGWRPNDRVPFQDFNEFLLLCLLQEHGADGIRAFADNVKGLLHNVRTARSVGSDNPLTGAVSVLPWLQADLCPRRERAEVIWPEDGALAMPLGYMAKPHCRDRLRPLTDYLHGTDLAAVLSKNRYPPTSLAVDAFPANARLKWPGWDYVRSHDVAEQARLAACIFFSARRD